MKSATSARALRFTRYARDRFDTRVPDCSALSTYTPAGSAIHAVSPAYREAGVGRRLYEALADKARVKGVERAYLLTTTIAALAESWGFQRIDRDKVPATIRETTQFHEACCASAVAMWQDLRSCSPKTCSCS